MALQADRFKDNGPAGREAYKEVTQVDGTKVSVPYVAVDPDLGFNITVGSVSLGTSLSIQDGTTSSQKAAVDASGNLSVKDSALATLTGAITETAPGSDTASSGLNGRLQRIAQRLTSLIALLPSSLGQKTSANSLAVVVASDQSNLPVGLRADARQSQLKQGSYTLSATPNTVQTVAIPSGSIGFRLTSKTTSADILFAVDENPASVGSGSLTAGNTCSNGTPETRLVTTTAANLNVMSATASAVVLVEFF